MRPGHSRPDGTLESPEGAKVRKGALAGIIVADFTNQASAYAGAGVVPEAMGNRHPSIARYEVFHAKDRPLVLAVGNDRQFRALCDRLGRATPATYRSAPPRLGEDTEALLAELGLPSRRAAGQADEANTTGTTGAARPRKKMYGAGSGDRPWESTRGDR